VRLHVSMLLSERPAGLSEQMMNRLRVWGGKIKDYTETGRRPLCAFSLRECSKANCVTRFPAPLKPTELKCLNLITIIMSSMYL
jgi:hypothetical protein